MEVDVKKHLQQMSNYPSLLVSSTAKTALMEIEELERQVRIARLCLSMMREGFPVSQRYVHAYWVNRNVKKALQLMEDSHD